MTKSMRHLDRLRDGCSEVENDLIDELLAGRIGRRELLRHGSVLGLSLPLLGGIAGLAGLAAGPRAARAQGTAGATVRVAMPQPTGAIDPVTVPDSAGLLMLHQVGDFLCVNGPDLILIPALAESWSPNADATVWTFKIRQGVKFHDGRGLTAADVVASINRLADPAGASNALSAFKGVLGAGGAKQVDDFTVAFELESPNGNFPNLVSSDNYNSIILPADYAGDFEQTFNGTGPFKIEKYTPKVGVTFVRNEDYWNGPVLPARVEFLFYDDMQARILALQGDQVDLINQVSILQARILFNDPNIEVLSFKSVAHQQVHMRTDIEPFADKRVRQAMAMAMDRDRIVQGLFMGRAKIGNDSPFSPSFPSTDPDVPPRPFDAAKAKALLAEAGKPNGFEVTLNSHRYLELPEYAQLIQNAAKAIGVTVNLEVATSDVYYGKAVFGESPWLDSAFGITDYGHRGVPNVYLSAPLLSSGSWNSAHFKNPTYDKLVAEYIGALDIGAQRAAAGKIQNLLLDETPLIIAYFYDYLLPKKKNLMGVAPIADRLFLKDAYFA